MELLQKDIKFVQKYGVGVSKVSRNRFRACVSHHGVVKHIGRFNTAEEAVNARNQYIITHNLTIKPSVLNQISCLSDIPLGLYKHGNMFVARVKSQGKTIHIGMYDLVEDAVKARNKYITENNLPNQLSILDKPKQLVKSK